MTSNTAEIRILGSLRTADGRGVVRMEDRFDTDIGDLWSALTEPARLARWLGTVEGDLRIDGEFRAHFFASGWEGTGRVDACEAPQRLLVTTSGDGVSMVPGDNLLTSWREMYATNSLASSIL